MISFYIFLYTCDEQKLEQFELDFHRYVFSFKYYNISTKKLQCGFFNVQGDLEPVMIRFCVSVLLYKKV